MRTVLRASLRTHTRRYVAAALAVTIGVAFIVVTSTLASSARNGMVAAVELPYRNADVVVADVDGEQAGEVIDDATARGDRAAVLGWTIQQVRVEDRLLPEASDVGALADSATLRWQQLREGRFPGGPGEAVADANAAKSDEVSVGDTIRVGTGSRAVEATVVGLVDTPSASLAADFYLTWQDARAFAASFHVDAVAYVGPGSSALADRLGDGGTVQARDTFVEERQTQITNEVNILAMMLLLFAAIALFVSVLVIANTFSILFAQRRRDFALLRCVGATKRQVLRSVRVEALLLGLASAVVGLLAGTGLGYALVALAKSQLPSGTMGAVTPSPRWYAGAFVTGVLVTVVAAWLPTRRAVRVSPLAALRPDDATDVRTRAGRVRVALGVAVAGIGAVLLVLAMGEHSPQVMIAGGVTAFSGVLLLGPVLVPGLIRAVGGVTGRLAGAPGRLASGNAVRNPRRTAATTASLLVGVTLTTAVLTGLASSRSAVDDDMDAQYPVDLALTSTGDRLPDTLLPDVRAAHGVVAAVALDGTTARVSGVGAIQVVAAEGVGEVTHGTPEMAHPRPDEIWVPWDAMTTAEAAGRVAVTVGDRTETLRLRGGEGWGGAAVLAPATLSRLTDAPTPRAIWVRADAGTDAEDLAGDLDALARPVGADLANSLAKRSWVDLQLDILTGTVVALLGIAVVIALIGIGNTLGLSVLERGRENSLLRALGLTRRQLRVALAVEALLLSVVATVVGTAIGVTFAWVGVQTMVRAAVEDAPMVLPWGQLTVVVLVAGAAGLLSSLLPARRAARTAPAVGLSLD